MVDVGDCMSAISIDSDVSHVGEEEEREVDIQLRPLALCPAQDLHARLQDGQLKPVVDLVWEGGATFASNNLCTYTLITHFRSDDVARRFHGDLQQQLTHRKFARLRKLVRVLSDRDCLVLGLSLASDRVVLETVHEKPVLHAQPGDARGALVVKSVKKELLPRWSRESDQVQIRLLTEDRRTQLDRRLSDLEETNRISEQRSMDQLRMIREALDRIRVRVGEEMERAKQAAVEEDLQRLADSANPLEGRRQKEQEKPYLKVALDHFPLSHQNITVRTVMMNDDEDDPVEPNIAEELDCKFEEEELQDPDIRAKATRHMLGKPIDNFGEMDTSDLSTRSVGKAQFPQLQVLGKNFEQTPRTPPPSAKHKSTLGDPLGGDSVKEKEYRNPDVSEKVMRDILRKPTEDFGMTETSDPFMDTDGKSQFPQLKEYYRMETTKDIGLTVQDFDETSRTPPPSAERHSTSGGLWGEDSVGDNTYPADGQKEATPSRPPAADATSGPAKKKYNDIPPDPKCQPGGVNEYLAQRHGGSESPRDPQHPKPQTRPLNVWNDIPQEYQQPSQQAPRNVSNTFNEMPPSPNDLHHQGHKHQTAPKNSNANDGSPGYPNFPNVQPRASNARELAKESAPARGSEGPDSGIDRPSMSVGTGRGNGHINSSRFLRTTGTHYQRQSTSRMTERLEWARSVAAVEETPSPRSKRGMDTVLCLDNSLSMLQEGAFEEMKQVALQFIEGLEEVAEQQNLEENVAVVTMGGGAKIQQHLTNDYSAVRDAIESLAPQGWTPFFETLVVGMEALNRRGKVIAMGRHHRIPARIICLTDGYPSDETAMPQQDVDPTTTDTNFRLLFVQNMPNMVRHTHDIYWVPVGRKPNMTILQTLETLKAGTVVKPEVRHRLPRHYFTQNLLGHVLHCKPRTRPGEGGPGGEGELADISDYEPFILAMAHDVSEEDREEVRRCLRDCLSKPLEESYDKGEAEFTRVHVDPSKLPLGTRVVRGPDWIWGEQDGGMAGTVVKHRRRDGKVEVQWDHGGREAYRYEQGGSVDVMEAPEGTPPVHLDNRLICVGANVQRGPDWSSGDADGGPGSVGVVIDSRDDGRVKVAWKNGTVKVHSFGHNDLYEVFVCDDAHGPPECGAQASGTNDYNFLSEEAGGGRPPVPAAEARTVWQWEDEAGQWRLYPEQDQDKISRARDRRPSGSCLVSREGASYRVLFTEMVERSVQDKSTRRVRRTDMSKADYQQLRTLEETMSME